MARYSQRQIKHAQHCIKAFEKWRNENPDQWSVIELEAVAMARDGKHVRLNRIMDVAALRGFGLNRHWTPIIGRALLTERGIRVAMRPTIYDLMIPSDKGARKCQ